MIDPLILFVHQRRRLVLPLVVLATLVVVVINEMAFHRSKTTLSEASSHAVQRAQARQILRLLLDAETGQRGYLLTGRVEYLEPYNASVGQVQTILEGLNPSYANDAIAKETANRLHESGLSKLSELAQTIEIVARGRREAALDLMMSDIGREKMETVRESADALFQIEDQRVAASRDELVDTFTINRIGVNAMAALGLLALFLYQRQTATLEDAQESHNQALQRERDQLDSEVQRRTRELTDLASHLEWTREDERSLLARELHDELGALLTAAKLDAARLKRSMAPLGPEAMERLGHLNATIDKGISLKRNIIENLRPSSLSNLGLVPALEIQAREFASRSDIKVDIDFHTVRLSDSAQITVYRLVQESLTNIAKYAQATLVQISLLEVDDGGACIRVRDNGRGFDPTASTIASHGLRGMRYRVESEGGRMRIESSPGKGASIEAWVPGQPEVVGVDDPSESPANGGSGSDATVLQGSSDRA
ncbi:MAG: CHASE3 domain-containing protein [Rubrivivax sp.]